MALRSILEVVVGVPNKKRNFDIDGRMSFECHVRNVVI